MSSEQQTNPEPVQLPMAPNQVRTAALAELDRLQSFVQGVAIADWSKPSAVSGWTIGDVVAHLNLAMGAYGRLLEAVLEGKGSGNVWKALGRASKTVSTVAGSTFHAVNSALPRVIDRALAPEVIQAQFAASSRTLRARLERIESNDYTRPVYWFGGPWPLSFFLAMVVNELAVHGWDMASRFDSQAHLGEEARLVLPWFYWSGTPLMLQGAKQLTGTVQVSLSDPMAEMWWSFSGSERKQGVGQAARADATITGISGTFVLALAGRILLQDALRTTSLQISGKDELARGFLGGWKIV